MEAMNIEPTQNEPMGFMQRWHERWRVRCGIPSLTSKIIYVCLMLLIIAVSSFIYFSLPSNDLKENVNIPDLELQNLAVYYMKSLEPNWLPCEDFYTFACGNQWYQYGQKKKHRFATRAMMVQHTRVSLDDFLTKPLNTSDSATSRQLKIFHQMCINKTKVETEGIEPVLTLLEEIGGWPLLTNDSENNESWETIVGSLNRAGFATFFPYNLQLFSDPIKLPVMAMKLDPLPATRVLPNETRTADYVKLVALLLNATNDRLDDDIKDCIDFESELQESTNSVVKQAFFTLESLRLVFSEIAWETFFRNVFVSTGIEVSSNETVFLSHLMYNIRVSELLNKTSTKIIRNYIVWRLIVEAIPLMPEKFREAKNTFEQRTVAQSRNVYCLNALVNKAQVSIGYFYIKNHLDGLAQKKADGMIKNIKSQAYQFLKNISWMDNDTNAKIIESLKNLEFKVPHPDDIDVMETLEFQSNDTFFANYRRLVEAQRNFLYGRLRMSQKANRQLIPFESAVETNGIYLPSAHIAFVFAAAFQRPLFSASQPMYLNYGGIGVTMAHELTHGLKILSFCNNKQCPSFDRFQEKKDCVEKLYNGYFFEQVNKTVDGKATLQENICDLIGLKLSYRAYEEFAKDSEEQLIPGLEYTERQWFWINAATYFCKYESDSALRNTILNGSHSPAEARINVVFANTDEFSRDFECPIGSRMNPIRKCEFER